jgi:hypothetical protein
VQVLCVVGDPCFSENFGGLATESLETRWRGAWRVFPVSSAPELQPELKDPLGVLLRLSCAFYLSIMLKPCVIPVFDRPERSRKEHLLTLTKKAGLGGC